MEEKSGAFLLSPLTALRLQVATASSICDPRGLRIHAGGLGTPHAFSTLWIGGVVTIGHCFSKVAEFHNSGATVLFTPKFSSSVPQGLWCSRSRVGVETFFYLHGSLGLVTRCCGCSRPLGASPPHRHPHSWGSLQEERSPSCLPEETGQLVGRTEHRL